MRSNIFYSFAAVFVAFALPIPATADQAPGTISTVSAAQELGVREVPAVIVEVKRAI
jgi:hypothetical protein